MRKKKFRLSVALATFNEEENIGRCLRSVRQLADEIIVVDGSSTDQTVEIAKKLGAKVTVTDNPPIFHINKQKAINQCSGDWILQLDADEVVTKELAGEIKRVIKLSPKELKSRRIEAKKQQLFLRHQELVEKRDGKIGKEKGEIVAFWVSRKNLFLGRYLMHGGVYPDGVIRLVKKGKSRFPCKSVHEQIEIQGKTAWLENSLHHYDSPTLSRYLSKAKSYTSLTADELLKKRVGLNFINHLRYFVWKPARTFISLYFRHKGFLDGFQGFIFALFSALHFPIAYIKYWKKKNL